MQALILAGGAGTRLRPLTSTVPKPVLPLANRPHIAYVIDWLERHGVDDVVVSCGHLADGVRAALEGFTRIPVRFAEEPEARGTAGAIKFCEEMLAERFLVLNGDVLCDLDLSAQIAQHEETGARATIALYPVDDPTAYGLVRRTGEGAVTEFLEKPDPAEIDTDEINAGAYVLERGVLELVPPGKEVSIEREVFPLLVGDGLYGTRLEGYWIDIGTPDRFLQANWDILECRVETVLAETHTPGEPLIGEGAQVADATEIGARAVVGAGCEIGAGASIVDSVLLENCRVGESARLRGAILSAGVEVAPGAEIDGDVIGEGETVGAPA
ncbi:MAG TPA: NDP-sugar synthase [Solirubrobacterales bacterium]|nr:NDP-sugar synthase [Solirubrobacterales bacterium]